MYWENELLKALGPRYRFVEKGQCCNQIYLFAAVLARAIVRATIMLCLCKAAIK